MRLWLALAATLAVATPAMAAGPRDMLVNAAFATTGKPAALALVDAALQASEQALARAPADREARLQHAIALGYRAQLKRSLGDAKAARKAFEALAASSPGDAEAQMGLAAWNLGTIIELGPMMARAALGARRDTGLKALDRAVASGGGRAFFPAYASFLRIRLDPKDIAGARRLAERAVDSPAVTPIDRITRKYANSLLEPLRAGDGKKAAALAKRLMAFGRLK